MKTIGLIGGLSWESTVSYYRILNQVVKEKLGGLHSAKIVLYSVDFAEIHRMQGDGDWDEAGRFLGQAARKLEVAGADFIVLCTNTMHKVAGAIQAAIGVPLLHIVDSTARAAKAGGYRKVGLLGTAFTMEEPFYKDRLRDQHGLQIIVPTGDDRKVVHRVIYEELCQGKIVAKSREEYRTVMARLVAEGAEAIILGCTEISMLVSPEDSEVPLLDTTLVHARQAAEMALE